MNGHDIRQARTTLGKLWGIGRALHCAELGRALRLSGADVGQSIRDYERGTTKVSGPMSAALDMMLNGSPPADPLEAILTRERADHA